MMQGGRMNLLHFLTIQLALVPMASMAFASPSQYRRRTLMAGTSRGPCSTLPVLPHRGGIDDKGVRHHGLWGVEGDHHGFRKDLLLVRGGGGGSGGGITSGGGGGGGGESEGEGVPGGALIMSLMATLGMVWRRYAVLLETKPVITKSITAGFIAVVGDILAQLFEHKLELRRLKPGEEAPPLRLSLLRCLAVTIEGLLLTGPGLHFLYTTLESMVPSQGGTLAALTHVAVDEFIFDPIFVLGFFFLCGLIEGKDLKKDIVPQVQREYWPALRGGWVVSVLFFPLEFATFRCLPLRVRVLVVNLTDVVWTAVVSFFSHLEETSPLAHHLSPPAAAGGQGEGKGGIVKGPLKAIAAAASKA